MSLLTSFFFFLRTSSPPPSLFFFFNDTATTEIYTLSLHDALPISAHRRLLRPAHRACRARILPRRLRGAAAERKRVPRGFREDELRRPLPREQPALCSRQQQRHADLEHQSK